MPALALSLALALLCPVLVAAHGQLSWVQIGSGPQYPAWTLDDYYVALYRESGQSLSPGPASPSPRTNKDLTF